MIQGAVQVYSRNYFLLNLLREQHIQMRVFKYPRLLMSILRSYGLGDRDDGEIKIQDNSVVVGISKYRENPALLQFE